MIAPKKTCRQGRDLYILHPSICMAEYMVSSSPHGSPLAYNEDEIVALMTEIYGLYVDIGYFVPLDISLAPKSGHPIENDMSKALGLSQRVVSLIGKLPRIHSAEYDKEIAPGALSIDYFSSGALISSRDPHGSMEREYLPRITVLEPSDVALTQGKKWGSTWILDTDASMCWHFFNKRA